MTAMIGIFGTMANKMTEAFERIGVPVAPETADTSLDANSAVAAKLAEKDAELSTKDAELERIRKELEQLKQSVAQAPVQPEETAIVVLAFTTVKLRNQKKEK